MHLAFARQGTLVIPTTLGFLNSMPSLSYLRAWVDKFSPSESPLTRKSKSARRDSHCDFRVRWLWSWYSSLVWFPSKIRGHDANETAAGRPRSPPLIERIYLVPVVEPQVLDGQSSLSLQPGVDYTSPPRSTSMDSIVSVNILSHL
jgi:hypothetical protein